MTPPTPHRCAQIPPEYGGSSPYGLGSAPEEVALRELAESLGPTSLLAASGERPRTPASPRTAPAPSGTAPGSAADHARGGGGTSPARAGEGRSSRVAAGPRRSDLGGVRDEGQGRQEGGKQRPRVSQRLASVVRRMRGAGGGGATMAYLGVENRFRYDGERRMWVMDGEESEGIVSCLPSSEAGVSGARCSVSVMGDGSCQGWRRFCVFCG